MVEKHSDSEQDRGEGHNSQNDAFFNPFAVAKQNQNSAYAEMNDDFSADSNKDEQDDDEEADFAKVSDMVGSGLRSEVDITPEEGTKAQQMVTTAAFRMSANDDLKKTANWSSAAAQETHDSSNKRLDWAENDEQQKLGATQHPKTRQAQLQEAKPRFATESEKNQFGQESKQAGTNSNGRRSLLITTNHGAKIQKQESKPNWTVKHSTPQTKNPSNNSKSNGSQIVKSSKMISASNVTFVNRKNKFNSPTAPENNDDDEANTSSLRASESFLSRLQTTNNPQSDLHINSNSALESSEPMNPFEQGGKVTSNNIEKSCSSIDPLQQTFALLNTSETPPPMNNKNMSLPMDSDQQTRLFMDDVNPFTLSAHKPFQNDDDYDVDNQSSNRLQKALHEFNQKKTLVSGQQSSTAQKTMLRLSKQQNSAAAMNRPQRFSLCQNNNASSNDGVTLTSARRIAEKVPSQIHMSEAGSVASGSNIGIPTAAVYRLKRSQISELSDSATPGQVIAAQQAKNNQGTMVVLDDQPPTTKTTPTNVFIAQRRPSRDRLVTGTTAAGSSENMFSRSSARQGSNRRQNSESIQPQLALANNVSNIQVQRSEREHRLRQFGANSLKPMSSEGQPNQNSSINNASEQVSPTGSSKRYSTNNLQQTQSSAQHSMRAGPVLVTQNQRFKEFQEVFSPGKPVQQNQASVTNQDYRRLNSQQWQSSNIKLLSEPNQRRTTEIIPPAEQNQFSPLNIQHQPKLSGPGKFHLGGNPFEQAAKLGLIAPDDPRLIGRQINSPAVNFSKNRVSDDFGGFYMSQEPMNQMGGPMNPSSPMNGKKAQSATKPELLEITSGGGMPTYQQYGALRAPAQLQSAGTPFGNQYPGTTKNPTMNMLSQQEQANSIFRKISSQGLMQPSYQNSFDNYQSHGMNNNQQQLIEHFPEPKSAKLKVACSANHILIGDQAQVSISATNRNAQRNVLSRHSMGNRPINQAPNVANTSFASQKAPSASRPIASKNMPQCFRPNSLKRAQPPQQPQHVRANSMGAVKETGESPQQRSFSNDARFLIQQRTAQTQQSQHHQQHQQQQQPASHVLNTAQGMKRAGGASVDFNQNYAPHEQSYTNQEYMAPDRAAALVSTAPRGQNELSLIHEMFPKFAVAPSSPPAFSQGHNNNHLFTSGQADFKTNQGGSALWENLGQMGPDDPFKQQM